MTSILRRIAAPLAATCVLACATLTPVQAAQLRSSAVLTSGVVRLCDLFDDAGPTASRILGPGPGVGGRIVIEAPQLAAIARQFGVDWHPASMADRVVLDRPGRPMRREPVVEAIRAALVADGAPDDSELELPAFAPPLIPLDGTATPLVGQIDYDHETGRFTVQISLAGDGMDPISLRIAGRVLEMTTIPVATARLLPGSVVREGDLRMARMRATQLRSDPIRNPAQAVGMSLRHPVAAGQPLAATDLEIPPLVRKGANVAMALESAGISLTAQGQALDSGAAGASIRILNPASHAVVMATVIGPDRVRVDPDSTPVTPAARAAQVAER